RYDFDHLGLCTAPPGQAPAGLTDTVLLANCGGAQTPSTPCGSDKLTPVIGPLPKPTYTCRRLNVVYVVRRYVAWGDTVHTVKRMAVFVDWTDQVGRHEVSQQSSLRSPDLGSFVGLGPAKITNTQVRVGGTPANVGNPEKTV